MHPTTSKQTANTVNTRTKRVEYSYPTSTNATRFGFGKTGCYCVELCEGVKPPKAIASFAELEKARAFADVTLREPWDRLTR